MLVATVIRDQQEAGLDIVTDGNMWYDDYVGVIGSFCWYTYERIGGFDPSREPHPSVVNAPPSSGKEILDDWGGVIKQLRRVSRTHPVGRSLQDCGEAHDGAGQGLRRRGPREPRVARLLSALQGREGFSSFALAPIFNKEMKDLVAAGAKYLQFEDLGAWLPLFTGKKEDYKWIRESVEMCCDGVDAKIGWHFCFGNAWGNDILSANYPDGYQTVLPYFFGTAGIDEFVLDYANRGMAGVEFLKTSPRTRASSSASSTSAPMRSSRRRRSPTGSAARSNTSRPTRSRSAATAE